MTRLTLGTALTLALVCQGIPATADQADDCRTGCEQTLTACIEKARLNAGHIQEEQDQVAACEKTYDECRQACEDPNRTPPPASPEQSKEKPQEP